VLNVRILQVCPYGYLEKGGVNVHVRNISEHLAYRHDVTVYATRTREDESGYPRYEWKNGVKVERFRSYAPHDAYYFSLEMLLRLPRVDVDVVHAHSYHALPMHFSTLAKCKKFIITPHFHSVGHSPLQNALIKLFKPVGKRTLRKADMIVAVSEHEKSLICEQFGFSSNEVVVIPNGVNFSEFVGLRRRDHDFKSLLYVGYLASFKGPQYLIEVLPKLENDVFLEIVGDGPLRPLMQKRANELKVQDKVRFWRNLSRRELLQKYFDADVFLMLSKREAYSLTVAESLVAGTPCIVANTSALSEWVDNTSCFGIGVPVDLDELAALVRKAIGSNFNRIDAKKRIGTKILDWEQVAGKLESIYME